MKNISATEKVGDAKSPALLATESGLRPGVDQKISIPAIQSNQVVKPSAAVLAMHALKTASAQKGATTSCKQTLWLSFFFDGTGNNQNADIGFRKHSNIAKLYRAHKPLSNKDGILSIYIPGVGTYFPQVGDDGGSPLGLGCGAKGEERLNFALEEFDKFVAEPLALAVAPANAIQEINIAVFGFSRGAALARAFLNMVMKERCKLRENKWILIKGAWPVRFRFLGLFDTVASVGVPMSSNTTGLREAYNEDPAGMIEKRLNQYKYTRPEILAFAENGRPGADPGPGLAHGHEDWGGRLKVDERVEEVRHFVAAHEVRNSFPLDSISTLSNGSISKPDRFHETVFPGAHSDVGGSYAPGESGRGLTSTENLGLIPLIQMYQHALKCGVPMLAEWKDDNKADFNIDPKMCDVYNYYTKSVGSFSTLGEGVNKHMSLYYAWRFRSIRRKAAGDKTEAKIIESQNVRFAKHGVALGSEVNGLTKKEVVAKVSLNALEEVQSMQTGANENVASKALTTSEAQVGMARQRYEIARSERLMAKARLDALPNMKNFQVLLELYDKQLLEDVSSIRTALYKGGGVRTRSNLRPHYRSLLEAYENEFEKNSGLTDEKIISFFDNYVHDSLVGFAKDATLPSDPRVVYLGGDAKYRHAGLEKTNALFTDDEVQVA